jgi:hypothetical protein
MIIPFVDLRAQYLTIKSEIDAAIAEVIARSAFIRGSHVEALNADSRLMEITRPSHRK